MKQIPILFIALLLSISGYGQTTAAAYNFTATTGTYASISATGTLMGTAFFGDDRNQSSIPIGFTFTFCGATYTQLSACSNGWLSLNNSTSTVLTNSAANVTGAGFLAPFWDDLNGAGHTAYYQTTGTSPNRIFTFEFNTWGSFTGSGTCNMQVKLYESGNVIEFWYGSSTYASHSGSIGIANSTTDYQMLPNSGASPTPSSTTFTTNIATSPASGQVYRWYGCPVTASATNSGSVCPGGTVTLTGTTSGTGYSWAGPGGYTSTDLNPVINGIATSGIYTLSANNGSCTVSATTNVSLLTAPPAPVVVPSVATICNGNSVSLNATLPPAAVSLIPFQGWETGVPTVAGTPVAGWNTTTTSTAYITQVTAGTFPSATPHSGTFMADFHSWSYGSINVSLISPSFSMAGITGGQITFWMYRDNGYNTATYNLEGITLYMNTTASTAGATTLGYVPRRIGGTVTGSITGTSSPAASGWYQYTCTIPAAFAGSTNYILFNFNSQFGNDIYLDDISVTGLQALAPPVWTPITDLYTNPAFTAPYIAGDTVLRVYVHPTGVVTSTTTSYIATITNGVCSSSDTAVITVTPGVPPITGTTTICVSTSATLSNPTPGGTWSTSNTTVATIDPTTGVVYGIVAGIDTVYYTTPGGCSAFTVVTITTTTTATVGNTVICNGGFSTSLSNPTTGGVWTTSDATIAAVTSSGAVTSGAIGTAIITYTLPNGCTDTTLITSSAPPAAITGSPVVCYNGGITTLASATPGGAWTSSNSSVAAVDAAGTVTGITAGAATITYTSMPGCFATLPITLNANPPAIAGTAAVCEAGSTTTLSNAVAGGMWLSSSPGIAAIDSMSGVVTGIMAGSATITYTAPNNCYITTSLTVNPLPAPIAGSLVVCQTDVTTLTDSDPGGTWTSGAPSIATVNAGGGVGGILGGLAPITYTLPTGCRTSVAVNVTRIPAPITGNNYVCNGYTTLLNDTTSGGVWSSSNMPVATVDASGTVYGASVGTATISYRTGPGSCYAAKPMTVSPIAPPTVSIGASTGTTVCAGTAVTFTSTVVGGGTSPLYVWSVNNVILSGATSYTYVPSNGDVVRLWVLSSYECAVPDTSSAVLTMTVNPIVTPAVSLTTGMGDTVCEGVMTTLYAATVAGGTAPAYQWSVNGIPVSSGPSMSYSYVPANGDLITVNMTSSAPCRTAPSASATKILTVSPYVTPMVALASSLGLVMCEGYPSTFTAAQINGGTAPAYQWAVNGVNTTTGPTFSYAPANGDNVTVTMTSNFPCVSTPTATANTSVTVIPVVQPIGVVSAVPGYIVAPGMYDTFTCTILSGGGIAPLYQWFKSGYPVPGATTNVYITNELSTGDSVTCVVTNTDECSGVSVFNYVIVTVGYNVGVANVTATAANITMQPNPNNGTFSIKGDLGAGINEDVTVEVTNMLGQVVYTGEGRIKAGELNERISLTGSLANGSYLLNLRSQHVSKTIHFSLQQ